MSKSQTRVNYDQIAHLYDGQPYRDKRVDPNLLLFVEEYASGDVGPPTILDMGCGTGNQLIANRLRLGDSGMVGLDLFYGMLQQAQDKESSICWVQADSSTPPFVNEQFDYISNQFSFHHVNAKKTMMRAVFRILRPGGRFVMTNICPHEMTGWLYYRYFPDALAVDLVDFPPVADLVKLINKIGFEKVSFDLNYISEKIDLRSFLQAVHRRDTCSQLLTISDEAYQAGLRQLQIDITRAGDKKLEVKSDICLLTLQADKPVKGCRLRTSRGYL